MGILSWDKPKQIMTEEQRRAEFSSDSGVPGTFMPNMRPEDVARWKAKLTHHTTDHPQVEIRKDATVIIVSLRGGYTYKHYKPEHTENVNLHIATAGPIMWSFQELEEFKQAVEEAVEILEETERGKKAKGTPA